MASKKRSSDFVEEVAGLGVVDTVVTDKTVVKALKKKTMTKDKKQSGDTGVAPSPSPIPENLDSAIPMERKKKRKAMDKERHRSDLENKEPQPKQVRVESEADVSKSTIVSSSNSGFHISVFNDLASADLSKRIAAVETLVTELVAVQKAYEKCEHSSSVEGEVKLEAENDDGMSNCDPSLRYAVRRLIRGVSSSREYARQGFALGLTALVHRVPSIPVDSLMKLIVDFLEVSSSMKGQEVRDCLLGRLFGYGALVRSERIIDECNADKSTHCIKVLTSALISLAGKKRYLQEPAVIIILDLVEKLPDEVVQNHVLEAPGLNEWLEGAPDVGNSDALLFALRIHKRIPSDCTKFRKLLPNPFSASSFFASDHLSSLANCFKESTFCQPRVHSLWPCLVSLLSDMILQAEDAAKVSSSSKKHKKNRKCSSSGEETSRNVRSFCDVIIEGCLLSSSHDRKHLAFDVLLLVLPKLPATFVPIVLSYKLVQCLMDILSTKDSWLYKVAQSFIRELSDSVKSDDDRRVAVVVALQKHSNGKFDCITRTKTVKNMMADFKTESGCMLFIQNLTNLFVDEEQASEEPSDQSHTTDDNSDIGSIEDKDFVSAMGNSEFLKTWVAESLTTLRNLNLDPKEKIKVQKGVLKFLAVQGLFSSSLGSEVTSFKLNEKFRWPKGATSSTLCRMCIEQIQTLLASAQKFEGSRDFRVLATAQKLEGSRPLTNGPELSDLGSYFMHYLRTLRDIPSVSLFRILSGEEENTFTKLHEMENKLSKEEKNCAPGEQANKLNALRYLLIQLLLELVLKPGEVTEAASEIIMCCKKTFAASEIPGSSEEDEFDGVAPELMDVLVDTLLSLLPNSSAAMRSAIDQVFKYFCDELTDDGLMRMLNVIKKALKVGRHQKIDSEDDSEGEVDFLEIEEDDEIDEAESGENEDQADDTEAVSRTENGQLLLSEDFNDSDEALDDAAMFRMDSYLVKLFKEKKDQAGNESAQSQLILFKLRVLSLLEIYLQVNQGKPQVVTIYSNLSQSFVNPNTTEGSEQLGQRILGIIQKKIFKAKEVPKDEALEISTLVTLLEKNLKLASKVFKNKKPGSDPVKKKKSASWSRHEEIVSLGKNSTFWILRMIAASNICEEDRQKVIDVFQKTLVLYFSSRKSQMKPDFLKEIFRRRNWIGHDLFGFMLENCGSSKSEFRRVKALDMMMEILKIMSNSSTEEGMSIVWTLLKTHSHELSSLIMELVTITSSKRKAEVRKLCSRVFQLISAHGLKKVFLEDLAQEGQDACQTNLGELFVKFKEEKAEQHLSTKDSTSTE